MSADRDARWPRGLRREDAARYVGVSPSKFDEMVADGRMPTAKANGKAGFDNCVIWDRFRLDDAFDAIPDRDQKPRWKAE